MEAFGSSIGVMAPSPSNSINPLPKCVTSRSASFGVASSCLVPYQRQILSRTSTLKVMLQKVRREKQSLACRSSCSEMENYVATKKTSQSLTQRKKLAVFVSGGGSNFRSIHEATKGGLVHGDISILVTDKPGCGGAEYARNNQIPVVIYPGSKSSPDGLSVFDLVSTLRKFEVDFILLAGFLKLIPVELVQAFPKSIFNIHPSLLPAFGGKGFYGLKVHKAVIQSGARFSGPTIHFVDEQYDTGRILAQRVVPVLADDTAERLAARVLHQEHELYVEVVSALCEDRIIWREDGVPLIRSKDNPDKLY
ncbi:phosphoribosylglycinamide formyltransferase, chloroplastic [Canna indica]|uniref:Phosphoribosylglycinamide formyltransferase, chloroplastic n=1 Tax=Canna indica TaxID=4628 RepID=A0AAQ3L0B3_9LILI|nr:phosphoribosylglycinamide formyltransferase, chloroplastic [Canna indica]